MQTASAAWANCWTEDLVPETFVEVSYKLSDYGSEVDASAAANDPYPDANTGEIVSLAAKSYSPYITLEHNQWLLNGTYNLLPDTITQSMGYISNNLCDWDCTFSANPVITISFTQVHNVAIPGITITWSSAFNEYASSYIVTAYNGNTVVATTTVTDNTEIKNLVDCPMNGYNRITIEILSWSLPLHRARIEQIIVGWELIFTKDNLIGFEQTQTADLLSFNLPKNEVVFKIDNVDDTWNPDNPQGIYAYMYERQQVKVKYGITLEDGIEWIECGTFFLSGWNTPQNGIQVNFTARDALEFMFNPFVVTAGTYTLAALATQAFNQSGMPTLDDGTQRWSIDSSLNNIQVTISADSSYTCAEMIQLCANAACCVIRIDRQGGISIIPLSTVLSEYVIDQYNSYRHPEYTVSRELQSVNVNDGQGVATNSSIGEIQSVQNELIPNATVANNVATWIKNCLANRKTLTGEYRSDPRLDALDYITVENKYATTTAFITSIKYTYNGAFRGNYEGRIIVQE